MTDHTLAVWFTAWCAAAIPAAALAQDIEATPQRPSFTTNTSLTQAGTFEIETGVQGTRTEQSLPSLLKYTPAVSPLAGRVEFALGFDAITHDESGTHVGDALTVQARVVAGEHGSLSFAVSPYASLPIQAESGPGRLGGTLIATIERGAYSGDINVGAERATGETPFDATAGNVALAVSRALGGAQGKLSLHASALADVGEHRRPRYSLLEGVTYKANPRVTLDLSLGEFEIGSGMEFALVAGATINFGYVRHWFGAAAKPRNARPTFASTAPPAL